MLLFRVILVFFTVAETFSDEIVSNDVGVDLVQPAFNFWPQKYFEVNDVRILNKRDTVSRQSEGGQIPFEINKDGVPKQQVNPNEGQHAQNTDNVEEKPPVPVVTTLAPIVNDTKTNATKTEDSGISDLTKPGVVKRGLIVFGGFALLAVAYFIFYRRKGKKNDNLNTNAPDSLQFRYGVLQSNERDNLELSRVPLTMESDEDDDDDLEIFDLEQKKKSLSYVNLKSQDENELFSIVNDTSIVMDNDKEQLLLDIDDKDSDILINLTGQHSKSVL